jgi:hypothetical protein
MVSAGFRAEGFAALSAVMTEANQIQSNWPVFVTPNFTTGSAFAPEFFDKVSAFRVPTLVGHYLAEERPN